MQTLLQQCSIESLAQELESRLLSYGSMPAVQDEKESYTFEQLVAQAHVIREGLRATGITVNSAIAIEMPRSTELVLFLVACTLEEIPWILLNPNWSEEKKNRLTALAKVQAIALPNGTINQLDQQDSNDLCGIAYLATSSGSTGEPKCAALPSEGLLALMKNQADAFQLQQGTRVLVMASPGFDAIVSEIFVSLWAGAEIICVVADNATLVPKAEGLISSGKIDFATMTPSVAKAFKTSSLLKLKTLVLAGEAADRSLIEPLLGQVRILNAYGPCEVSVCSHINEVTQSSGINCIGKALPHISARVVDEYSNEVIPTGTGELWLYGDAVALGYVGSTDDRLGTDPKTGERFYKTGDMVRMGTQSEMYFMGRNDSHIKIRGQKVNLNEIRNAALTINGISDANCMDVLIEGQSHIVLLYQGTADKSLVLQNLKFTLSSESVPKYIFAVDTFAINSNGKVDIQGLKAHALQLIATTPLEQVAGANLSIAEQHAISIWNDVLGRQPAALDEDFFDAGGDSLLLTMVFNRFQEISGKEFPLSPFIKSPKFSTLARLFETEVTGVDVWATLKKLEFEITGWPKKSPVSREIRTVLLTGATGKVGRHILRHLLKNTQAKIVCLGRGDFSRLRVDANDAKRICWINCDLANTSDLKQALLSSNQDIDSVIHCGAQVNHVYAVQDLFDANVLATYEILKFANLHDVARVLYISSISASTSETSTTGYDQSKGAAEKLVKAAMTLGMDIAILRLPLVFNVDEATVDELAKDHFLCRIKYCLESDTKPDLNVNIPILDARDCAKLISGIAFSKESIATEYQLVADPGVPWKEIFPNLKAVSYDAWRRLLIEGSSEKNALEAFLSLYQDQGPFGKTLLPSITSNQSAHNNLVSFLRENGTQIRSSSEVLKEVLAKAGISGNEKSNSREVDIWYDAIQLPNEVYEKEQALLKQHQGLMYSGAASSREIKSAFELWEGQPQRFFYFTVNNKTYVGQKLLSPIVSQYGSPGLFCSLIKPEMLLGSLIRSTTSQEGVEIYYRTMSQESRQSLFRRLKRDRQIDIFYPFNQLSADTRKEVNTPKDGWFITEERAKILGIGERHLRFVSARMVANDGRDNLVVYDPACSTGEFLAEIKTAVPSSFVIGQDLSAQMCEYAKGRLDKVIVGNSMNPGVVDESCDYIFFRFLNSEVVTTSLAAALFRRLMRCLKPGGKAILFGHTPVLVAKELMELDGFKVLSCNEQHPTEDAVFQYYVIQRS